MTSPATILHVCTRETILGLRDRILKLHGYEVDSTLSTDQALGLATVREYSLILIDVEGEGRIPASEQLCQDIKTLRPGQKVVFICNHRVSLETDCPDEIIRSEFSPEIMVAGIKAALE